MMIPFISFLVVIALIAIWAIAVYNKLIKLRNMKDEGWSGIDVQLKRRTNLIPNLIETVKGYMDHERSVLEKVTELRSRAMNATGVGEKAAAESMLTRTLGKLFAVAESYPDLKSNENFIDLQGQLAEIEDEIQMARRYYNGTARNLNVAVESFPNSIIAGMFNFETAEFYEITDESERAVPKVDFNSMKKS